MRRSVLALTVGASIVVAGCGIIRQRQLQARIDELKAQSLAASQQCDMTFPAGNPKTAMARAKCQTDALLIMRPVAPFPDLMDLFAASRIEIAERVQNGQLTVAQANEQIASKQSELVAEEQRRFLANRSIAAQQNIAAASLQASGPHSCTRRAVQRCL
jgi:hypothetical protein